MKTFDYQVIDGRKAMLAYLTAQHEPATKETAELIKIEFDDNGEWLYLDAVPVEEKAVKRTPSKSFKVRKGLVIVPINRERAEVRTARAKVQRSIYDFFTEAKSGIIPQVVRACEKHGLNKSDPGDLDVVDAVMGEIDFSVFNQLPDKVQQHLQTIHGDAATRTIRAIQRQTASAAVAVHPREDAFNQVSSNAVSYAKARSAELVGMKRTPSGSLIPNPDAKWQITDTTRDGIRSYVEATVKGELSVTELPKQLEESYGFSKDRATMIARTEINAANGAGALRGLKDSGVKEKVWLTSGDDSVSEECDANEEQGPIPVDEDFESGDDTDPAHPNCRCSVTGYISFDDTEEE